jgi:translation elongation factor EF-G
VLEKSSSVLNTVKDKKERVGRLLEMHAIERTDIDCGLAGMLYLLYLLYSRCTPLSALTSTVVLLVCFTCFTCCYPLLSAVVQVK